MHTITVDGETFVQFDDFPLNQHLFAIWHEYEDANLVVAMRDGSSYKIVDKTDFLIGSNGEISFYKETSRNRAYAQIIASIIAWANRDE